MLNNKKIHKLNWKRIKLPKLVLIIVLFAVSFAFFHIPADIDENIKNSKIQIPNHSSIHTPIEIDGNLDLNLFSSGSGTTGASWETAHIIENYIINADSSGSGIEIRNTNLYLIIRNINASNSGSETYNSGIYLNNCTNIKILNCNTNNNKNGITLYNSTYNNLTGNNIWENYIYGKINTGFKLIDSNYNTFSRNKIWDIRGSGFRLSSSSNNIISENNAWDNSFGFSIADFAYNNLLSRNNASENSHGFILGSLSNNNTLLGNNAWNNVYNGFLSYSSNILSGNSAWNNTDGFALGYTSNNNLSENNAWNNSNGFYIIDSSNNNLSENNAWNNSNGFYISDSSNNILSENNAWDNTDGFALDSSSYNILTENNARNNTYGFALYPSSNNNKIWLNYISNNVEEATDAGVNNQWDDGRSGNYWGDYIEKYPEASDIGGIWDTPYEIPGGTGALDKFPLVKNTNLDDTIPPNPEIPGFSLWFIFGFSLIGIFILIKQIKKK